MTRNYFSSISARSLLLIFLASGTIITGCLNSIFTKYQDLQCVENCDNPVSARFFEQPVLQTLQMFMGESMSWIVLLIIRLYSLYRNQQQQSYQPLSNDQDHEQDDNHIKSKLPLNLRRSFLMLIPACCDITGTTLMNVGLIYTPVSIYQMTRGSVVLFVAGMSMIFLRRKITRLEWGSLLCVSLGVVIVGLSGSRSGGENNDNDIISTQSAQEVFFGTMLILIAEIFIAIQFVVEEFIISKFEVPPLKLVALEGTFGGLITALIMILGYWFIGSTAKGHKGPFDLVNAMHELFSSKIIIYTSILIMLSIGSFNFFGISITNKLSATARSTVDTCRTLLVWVVSIMIGWESFNFLQFSGFVLLVIGTLVFNGVIDLNDYLNLPNFFKVDQPNDARVVDGIDEQIERF